jgi:hypothetical protein
MIRLAFKDFAQCLARDLGNFALQRADAGFARVILNQRTQAFIGQVEFAFLQAVRFGSKCRLAIWSFSSSV